MASPLPAEPVPVTAELAARSAMANDGHCGNWADFRRRLNGGRPFNMLAYGSSIVGGYGGCTRAVPGVCDQSSCPNCCGLSCYPDRGWARDVFDEMNSSWPHADNALYSLGQPGGGLAETLSACMRDYVLQLRIDVFLLDFAVTGNSAHLAAQLEVVVQMLVHDQERLYGHRPLLVFTSFNYMEHSPAVATSFDKILHRTREVQAVAVRWGWPHWSPWPTYRHLSLAAKRSVWIADLLHPRTERPTTLVAVPIYLAIARGVHECAASAEPPRPSTADRVPPHWTCLRWKSNGTFAAAGSHVASQFHVAGYDPAGWRNVTHERGRGGLWRVKPGLRSDAPGTAWQLGLATSHERFILRLEHLRSYEGYGAALLSCLSGCACSSRLLNATTSDRVSVSTVADIPIRRTTAPAPAVPTKSCIVQLRVVSPSFKVSSIAISGDVDLVQSHAFSDARTWAGAAWMDADNMMRGNGMHHSGAFNGQYGESKPAWVEAVERKRADGAVVRAS